MGKDSAISWCHHTFNLWWGCWKISAGCQHCYAATMDKRTGGDHWQRAGERKFMSAAYWRGPIAWNKAAAKAGERHRVFCGSMMDIGETHPNPVIAAQQNAARDELWNLILATPNLDWLLLTKRTADLRSHLPWGERGAFAEPFKNVWLGTSVEDQDAANERIPELLATPAAVRFLSCEPLIGPVDLDAIASSDASPHVRAQIAQIYALLRTLPTDERIAWTLRAKGRAGQARGDHAHAADRAAAGDQHRLADQIAGTVHRVQADRQRLGAGQLTQRDVFVHRRELVLAEHEALAEQALRMREHAGAAEEEHPAAQVEAPAQAVVAVAARVMDAVLVEVAMMRESFVCFSDGCIVHAALNGTGATLTLPRWA